MTINHDRLVQKAEALVWMLREAIGKSDPPEVGKTQASKAIEVAQIAPTPALLINWLRYQAAREDPEEREKRFWSYPLQDGRTLAEALITDLQEIQREVRPEERMRAVALYLGYFRRALVGIQFLDRIPPVGEGGEHGRVGAL